MTPVGVQEMLQIPGFGPKKIFSIWKDLEVDNVGELYYACIENRLGDRAAESSYVSQLKNRYPGATETARAQNGDCD